MKLDIQTLPQEIVQKFNLSILGQGDVILVFGHGFGCDKTIWKKITPIFESNYQIVTFDYVGCGATNTQRYDSEKYTELDAYAADLVELFSALGLNHSNSYFIGHSVSGAISLLASIQKPELFKKLIMVNPSPCYMNYADYEGGFDKADIDELLQMMHLNYFEWASYLAPAVVGSSNEVEHAEDVKLSFLKADPVISESFARVTFFCDIRQQLRSVSVPTCILYCTNDIIVPLSVIDYLQAKLANSSVFKLDATGHYPQITNPTAVADGIQQSIDKD